MCFGDGTRHKVHIREKSRDIYRGTRYGATQTYYPAHYYARPPAGPYLGGHQHHALHRRPSHHHHHHHHEGHFAYNHRHSAVLPSRHALVPTGINYGHHRYHPGGRAQLPSTNAMRTYYGMNPVMAGGMHSYSYPGVASTIIPPSTTTYTTVTNSAVPVPVAPMSSTTTTSTTRLRSSHIQTPHMSPDVHSAQVHSPHMSPHPGNRDDIQYENRRVAMERGSYLPRRIAPADARPDDPFWCRESTGEWHLRTYYQIENECHPGRWLMDAEHGFLVFHRE